MCYSSACLASPLNKAAPLPSTEASLKYFNCLSPACRKVHEDKKTRMLQVLERRQQLLQMQKKGSAPLINLRHRSSEQILRRESVLAATMQVAAQLSASAAPLIPPPVAEEVSLPSVAPSRRQTSAAAAYMEEQGPKSTGVPASSFLCYSAGSQCTNTHRCYSPRCRYFTSYWRCKSVRRMLARVKICCSLRCQSVSPFASFVPRALHEYLRELTSATHHEEVPSGSSQIAAVLFADASGFTALTERLSKNPNGAEELCDILNSYFTILVDIVHKFNGDIVKFAGDAVAIVWAVGETEDTPIDMEEAIKLAVACSCELHKVLDNYPATSSDTLRLHMGIGAGQLTCLHVGGVFARWEYVVSGPPMAQIAIAEPLALPGETVISPEALECVGDFVVGTRLELLKDTFRKKPPMPEEYDFVRIETHKGGLRVLEPIAPLRLKQRHVSLLKRYIPAAIQPALKAGHDDHLAEIREVSVLFVKCNGLSIVSDEYGNCANAIDAGQHLMLTIQHAVYAWEGSINKFLVDDKGMLILCVFGLPPMSHVDDAVRAVGAARMLIDILPKNFPNEGVECSVGVTTGRAFCGVVGSLQRREYTVMGDVVNLSARLMASAGRNEILVDETTKLASERGFDYFEIEPLELKGKSQKARAFRPIRVKQSSSSKKAGKESLQSRDEEFMQIKKMIARDISGIVIVLTGERGSGKSALVDALVADSPKLGFKVLIAHSSPIKGTPIQNTLDPNSVNPTFHSWQGVFDDLIKDASAEANMSPEDWVLSILEPGFHCHASLLNTVVSFLKIPVLAPQPPTGEEEEEEGQVDQGQYIYDVDEEEAAYLQNGESQSAEASDNDVDSDMSDARSETSSDYGHTTERIRGPNMLFDDDVSAYTDDLANLDIAGLSAQNASDSLKYFPVTSLSFQHKLIRMEIMLCQLLLHYATVHSTLVLLHLQMGTSNQPNVESESWRLAHRVHRLCKERQPHLPKLVLILVSRPLVNIAPIEFLEIAEYARQQGNLMQLKPLSEEQQIRHMHVALGVPEVFPLPTELVELILSRAAGNPKHIEELITQLLKEGYIEVENGRVNLTRQSLDEVATPEKMIGSFMGMIDCLQPRHLLIVKVASTFDMCFSLNMLVKLVAHYEDRSQVAAMLEELVESGIFISIPKPKIPAEVFVLDPKASKCYDFVSVILKQVVNKLMLDSNRQKLMADLSKMEMINSIKMLVHIQLKLRDWLSAQRDREQSSLSRTPSARKRSVTVNTTFANKGGKPRRESGVAPRRLRSGADSGGLSPVTSTSSFGRSSSAALPRPSIVSSFRRSTTDTPDAIRSPTILEAGESADGEIEPSSKFEMPLASSGRQARMLGSVRFDTTVEEESENITAI